MFSRGCGHVGAGEGRSAHFGRAKASNKSPSEDAQPCLCSHTPARTKSCEPGDSETHEVTQGLVHPIYVLQLLMPPQNSSMTRIPNETVRNKQNCSYWEVAPASLPFLFHRTSGKSEVFGGEQGAGCPGCHPSAWSRAEKGHLEHSLL